MSAGRRRTLRWVAAGGLVVLVCWGGYAWWRRASSVRIDGTNLFRASLQARPTMHGGLTAVYVTLAAPAGASGTLRFGLRESALGSIRHSYRWDWKSGRYPSRDFSFVDLTKQVQEAGVIKAWDVRAAVGGAVRLKIWRDDRTAWRAVAESALMTVRPGANHFVVRPPLGVERGDYIGLYTAAGGLDLTSPSVSGPFSTLTDQNPINLRLSTGTGRQYDFPGDASCGPKAPGAAAPHPGYSYRVEFAPGPVQRTIGTVVDAGTPGVNPPISLIDLDKPVARPGLLTAWEATAARPGTMRLEVWRHDQRAWNVVGESAVEALAAGANRFALAPPLAVQKGEYLGYASVRDPVVLYNEAGSCAALSHGQLYVVGKDVQGAVRDSSWTRDPRNGGYSFRALYAPARPAGLLTAAFSLRAGTHTYRFEIPDQPFAVGEQVTLSVASDGPGVVRLRPRLLGWMFGHEYVTPEYGVRRGLTRGRVVIAAGSWPIGSGLLVVLTAAGLWGLLRRRSGLVGPVLAILLVLAAAAVWRHWIGGAPVTLLLPWLVVVLLLPGFLVCELAFSSAMAGLDALERVPLMCGLSIACWVLIAPFAYRGQWRTGIVAAAVLLAELVGLLAVARSGWTRRAANASPERSGPPGFHRAALLAGITVLGALMAYSAQFQMSDFDVMFHLAGFRNIVDGARILNSGNVLGPGSLSLPQYTASPWYLLGGLAARQAHVDVVWLYVCLAGMLTATVLLAFYALLKTILGNSRVAALAILVGTAPWIYSLLLQWRMFWSFYLTFVPFASEVSELLLFPVTIAWCLKYLVSQRARDAVVMILLATATMGIHTEYLVHVPIVIGLMLLVSLIPAASTRNRVRTVVAAAVVGLAAGALAYATLAFPTRAPIAPMTEAQALSMWHAIWRPAPGLYGANPWVYFGTTGWKVVLGLVAVVLFVLFRVTPAGQAGWRGGVHLARRSGDAERVRLALGVVTAVVAPWFVVFDPVLVPRLVRLLHSTVPFYRMLISAGAASMCVEMGGAACVLVWLMGHRPVRSATLRRVIPAAAVVLGIAIPLAAPPVRQVVVGALSDYGWYPSLLDLVNDPLYVGLSRMPPGAVAVRAGQSLRTAALSPLNPIYVAADRIGDYRISEERAAVNEQILAFALPAAGMRRLLERYHCRYVILSAGSPYIGRFVAHPDLFRQVLRTPRDVVFETTVVTAGRQPRAASATTGRRPSDRTL